MPMDSRNAVEPETLAEEHVMPSASEEPRLVTATVLCVDAGAFLLATPEGQLEAARAPSCLLEPTTGDRVLAVRADGGAFVLAVLCRDATAPARIEVPGSLEVRAAKGRVLLAAEDVELASSRATTLTTPSLSVSALEGTFFVDRLAMIGSRIDAEVKKLSAVTDTIDTVADRIRQRCERYYRFVKGLDQTRAGTIDMKAETHARVHAYDTVVTADKLVKVDGTQIHMG
jgi:hypothetical protein